MFKNVGALAVYVTDLDRAKRFYTEVLGFVMVHDIPPDLCFLRSGSGEVDIYMEGNKKHAPVSNESSRLSFFLRSEEPAQVTHEALKRAGVRVLQNEPELVGDDTYCFQFEDPDGNIIEVSGSGK